MSTLIIDDKISILTFQNSAGTWDFYAYDLSKIVNYRHVMFSRGMSLVSQQACILEASKAWEEKEKKQEEIRIINLKVSPWRSVYK